MAWGAIFWALGLLAGTRLCVQALAGPADRRLLAWLWWAGLLAAVVKLALVMQAPQWLDVAPDSIKYQLHGQALWAHWQGLSVDASSFSLDGFLNYHDPMRTRVWLIDEGLSYHSVLGSHEWLYAAYLGVWFGLVPPQYDWVMWATWSHAVWMALLPVASYGIARILGAGRGVGVLAAALCLLDPSAPVNGAWLLKDTIASAFALVAIWAALVLIRKPNISAALLFVAALGGLGGVRFIGFAALLTSGFLMFLVLLFKKQTRSARWLAGALVGAGFVFSLLYVWPFGAHTDINENLLNGLFKPLTAQCSTLIAEPRTSGFDPVVSDWHSRLQHEPIKALTTAVGRTLFAPYPWVAWTHGLSGNAMELYYPGVLFWIFCLPGVVVALVVSMRTTAPEFLYTTLTVGLILGAYLAFMGEWSGRQRVFLLPVFFVWAAIGYRSWMVRHNIGIEIRRKCHVWLDRLFGPDGSGAGRSG